MKSRKHRESVLNGVKGIQVDQLAEKRPSIENSHEQVKTGLVSRPHASSPISIPTIAVDSCLFCPRVFNSLETTLNHMSRNHAFYIPDVSYCTDIPGLLTYLAQDISLGNICILCGHGFGGLVTGSETDSELVKRSKKGTEAVRKHMIDKGHCRIPWDTDDQRLELSDYYDYSSSYPDANGSKDEGTEMETEEWEDEDGSDVDETDEVVMDYSAVRRSTRKPMEEDLGYRLQAGDIEYELVLPNGQRIGHRALKGVYKQNVMREHSYSCEDGRDELSSEFELIISVCRPQSWSR